MTDLSQYLLSGLTVGCIYALVALGVVLVANVTGVFNFAQGEYVMVGGMVMAATVAAGWSAALGVLASMAAVSVLAVAQERLTVAPVRGKLGPLGLCIASLGVGVTLRGLALLIWDDGPRRSPPFDDSVVTILGARLPSQSLWVWGTTVVCLSFVVLLFQRTDIGRAMRASSANPVAARLVGIRIGRTSMTAFAIAGAMSGLVAAVTVPLTLVSWDRGVTIGLVGFIAAALAGFSRPVAAVAAGLALGMIETTSAGLISSDYRQAIVYGTLLAYLLGRDLVGGDGILRRALGSRRASAAGSLDAPDVRRELRETMRTVTERLAVTTAPTRRGLAAFRPGATVPVALLGVAALLPAVTNSISVLDAAVFVVLAAIGATGLGLVLGLAGQFSLGQSVFYLIGGYTAAILTASHGWSPLLGLMMGVAAAAGLGALIGWLTLGQRGFNLALATLSFLLIALVFVNQQAGLTGGSLGVQEVPGLTIFGRTIESPSDYLRFSLIVLGVCLLVARNVWYSRLGRTLRAIGIDQAAAESVGLDAGRLKLRVFILGAAMAGIAGVLWAYYLRYAVPVSWDVSLSINLVTYVIVGGALSPYGGAVGAVVVGVLHYLVQHALPDSLGGGSSPYQTILSGLLLVLFLLFFRGGLMAIPGAVAERVGRRRAAAAPAPSDAVRPTLPLLAAAMPKPASAGTPLLVVRDLSKRFGSVVAVDGLSFELEAGRVTAMIGPNGAGKSTVINLLSGLLLPTEGDVGIMGTPAVGLGARQIATLGVARTFQTPRLFEGMTTLETVMLARDRHGRAGIGGAALRTPGARRREAQARAYALGWLQFVGLGDEAETVASALPVGKQRMAEVARALAAEPAVLLLDEPAAGLDGTETAALGELVRLIGDLGIAVLLVEHDMGMVMSIADRVVVLERGRKIADGPAEEVGREPAVVEAYLGVAHA